MDDITALERAYGVRLPSMYLQLFRQGYANPESPRYLWVFEAEWIHPREIPSFQLSYCETIRGLLPFAFTGAGDPWCWNTLAPTSVDEFTILYCPHDEPNASIYAPSFPAWFYRNALDYASSLEESDDEISDARKVLRTWAEQLRKAGRDAWAEHLLDIASRTPRRTRPDNLIIDLFGFISQEELDESVAREFGEQFVEAEVRWHMLDEA